MEHTALHLRLGAEPVDENSASECGDDAVDLERAGSFDRHLGDFDGIGPECEVARDSAPPPFRQRVTPARLCGGELEDALLAPRIVEGTRGRQAADERLPASDGLGIRQKSWDYLIPTAIESGPTRCST